MMLSHRHSASVGPLQTAARESSRHCQEHSGTYVVMFWLAAVLEAAARTTSARAANTTLRDAIVLWCFLLLKPGYGEGVRGAPLCSTDLKRVATHNTAYVTNIYGMYERTKTHTLGKEEKKKMWLSQG